MKKKIEKKKISLLIFSLTFSNHHIEILNHNMADTLLKLAHYKSYSQSYFIFSIYSHSASNYELVSGVNGRRIPAGNLNKKDRISLLSAPPFSRYPLIVISVVSLLSFRRHVFRHCCLFTRRDLYVSGSV